jgi:hypothetical protein
VKSSGCARISCQLCVEYHLGSALTEKDDPFVSNELVEVDRTFGGLGLEVGGNRAQTETGNKILSAMILDKVVASRGP